MVGIRLADAVERESVKEAAKIREAQQDTFIGAGKKIMQTLRVCEEASLMMFARRAG